mgnify:CR=1 FL=1
MRTFNEKAAGLENTTVVNVSQDLPFAHARFCAAEGIDAVKAGSAFRSSFGEDYGVTLQDGPMAGLLARAVVVLDEKGRTKATVRAESAENDAVLAAVSSAQIEEAKPVVAAAPAAKPAAVQPAAKPASDAATQVAKATTGAATPAPIQTASAEPAVSAPTRVAMP